MHARAGDRRDVDDRTFGILELLDQPAGEHDRCQEIHSKDVVPGLDGGVYRGQARAAARLGRDCRVVDERMQLAVIQPLLDLADCRARPGAIREIDLDVILRAHFPGTILGECMARACDDAPSGCREALHRRMADAAARAGEQQSAAWLVGLRRRHVGSDPKTTPHGKVILRRLPAWREMAAAVTGKAASCATLRPARRAGTRLGRAAETAGPPRIR